MSCRRLSIVLERLPAESEYKTELRDAVDLKALPAPEPGAYGPWSQSDMLLARVGDLLSHWLWMNADPKGRPAQPPPPYPRPGVEDGASVTPISPEALAYLEYMRDHGGAAPPDDWQPALG